MAQAQDFTKVMQDMMAAFPMNNASVTDAFKTSAALTEKMTKVALDAAEKSTEISSNWTRETLAKFGAVAKAKNEPTDYTKAMTDFASASAEAATESLAAFAEVAKKVQMETVELMLSAGKDLSQDATAAVKKATTEATNAARKVTADASEAVKAAATEAASTVKKVATATAQ